MKISEFVHIHQNAGYKVHLKGGKYFLSRGMINYSFPQLSIAFLNRELVNYLKWRYLITVVKTDYRIRNTYEYILDTDSYDIDEFRKRTRTTVRKSIKHCEFKRPDLADLCKDGLAINKQALQFQKRKDKFLSNPKLWEKYISLLYENRDVRILGAYFNQKLIGYAIAYEIEGRFSFHLQHIDRDYSTYYPMSGLLYAMINQLLTEHERIAISDGIESFSPMPSLNKFKRYMRFSRVPITRVYVINPVFMALLKLVITYYVVVLGKRKLHHPLLQKVVSLYQGHRLLTRMLKKAENSCVGERAIDERTEIHQSEKVTLK